MSNETWKETRFTGFEVSTHGRVRSPNGRILKHQAGNAVHLSLGTHSSQCKISVPKLMWETFHGDLGDKYALFDGDLRLENLRLEDRCIRAKEMAIARPVTRTREYVRRMTDLLSMPWGSVSTDTGWVGGW